MMARTTYFEERARYVEQVSAYRLFLQSCHGPIRVGSVQACELAELRRAAERTWFVVSTWGLPWSWLMACDRGWTLIQPHPAEPSADSLAQMKRDHAVHELASEFRVVTRRMGITNTQLVTAAFECFLATQRGHSSSTASLPQIELAVQFAKIAKNSETYDEPLLRAAFELYRSWLLLDPGPGCGRADALD